MGKNYTFRAMLQELRTDKSLRGTAIRVTLAYIAVFAMLYVTVFIYNIIS